MDAAERAQLIRIAVLFAPTCFIILSALWGFLNHQGVISPVLMLVLLVLNIPLTTLGVFAIHRGTTRASIGLVKTLYSAGDIAPPRTYPRQDVMLVRGQYREAAEYF